MRFLLAVILTALAILFFLTALALAASGQLHHPMRIAAVLTALLTLGLALLAE
jgi:hypothetical protein